MKPSPAGFGRAQVQDLLTACSRRLIAEVSTWTHPHERNGAKLLQLLGQASGDFHGGNISRTLELILSSKLPPEAVSAAVTAELPATLARVLLQVLSSPPRTVGELASAVMAAERLANSLNCLCASKATIAQLTSSDTLDLLFTASTAQCPPYLLKLREIMLSLIYSVAEHHTSQATALYLHRKAVVQQQVENLRALSQFPPSCLVATLTCIVEFLKQSLTVSNVLVMDLSTAGGYTLFRDALTFLESIPDSVVSPTQMQIMGLSGNLLCVADYHISTNLEELLELVVKLLYVGPTELLPQTEMHSPYSNQHIIERCQMNRTDATSVRNRDAFLVLQWFFLHAKQDSSRLKVIELVTRIFAAHPLNYLILQELHTLSLFIQALETISEPLKDSVLRLVVFVVTAVNCVPFHELTALGGMLLPPASFSSVKYILEAMKKMIGFDSKYQIVFRDCGLFETCLKVIGLASSQHMPIELSVSPDVIDARPKKPITVPIENVAVVLDMLTLLVTDALKNVEEILSLPESVNHIISFVKLSPTRKNALLLLSQLIKQDVNQTKLALVGIVSLLQQPRNDHRLIIETMEALSALFLVSPAIKDSFRESNGFLVTFQILSTMDGFFSGISEENIDENDTRIVLLETLLDTCTAAYRAHFDNRKFFEDQIGFATITASLKQSHVLKSPFVLRAFQCLFRMATETLIKDPSTRDGNICLEYTPFNYFSCCASTSPNCACSY